MFGERERGEEPTGRPEVNSQEPVSDHSSRSSRIIKISNSVVIISGEFQQQTVMTSTN